MTAFTDYVTVITAGWLNSIDSFYNNLFGGATTASQARSAINAVNKSGDTITGDLTLNGNLQVSGTGAFTGDVTAPTQSIGDNSSKVATTLYVSQNAVSTVSPAFTGTPTAPTAAGGTSTTQLATTAFAANANNLTSGTVSNSRLTAGSTSTAGILQLTNSTSSTSTTTAATPASVKSVQDSKAPINAPSFTGTITSAGGINAGGAISTTSGGLVASSGGTSTNITGVVTAGLTTGGSISFGTYRPTLTASTTPVGWVEVNVNGGTVGYIPFWQ